MFDNIAPRYDFLNSILSLGIHKIWRRKAINQLQSLNPAQILDVASGTGDFAIEALRLQPKHVIGIDISEGMLEVGRKKLKAAGIESLITLQVGDSENLEFQDNHFDAVCVGFGVRNFSDLIKGLSEIFRVMRPGGKAVILEPAVPSRFPLKQLFTFYFYWILPLIGKVISKDQSAYSYLPESVSAFPNGIEFVSICQTIGFKKTDFIPLSFGICSLYVLEK